MPRKSKSNESLQGSWGTLPDTDAEIEELKRAAEDAQKAADEAQKRLRQAQDKARTATIKRITDELKAEGITIQDLAAFMKISLAVDPKLKKEKVKKPVTIKYRNPKTEELSTGRGSLPPWLRMNETDGKRVPNPKYLIPEADLPTYNPHLQAA